MKIKSKKKKVSIIIRTRNEEKWIMHCLRAVFSQTFKDFEVIIVDNKSTDKTVEKTKAFDVKLVEIEEFRPGKAINIGIRHAQGEIIVILSGHCIPVNNHWLAHLIRDLDDKKVAGVYGRQEPLSFSSPSDKRDLTVVFGLDKKVQKKDPFFHNANSAIRRAVWEKIPFDEDVTNIEDRVWGQAVVSQGYHLVYEPQASVYHYHGIHQDNDEERCRNVVRILESLKDKDVKRPVLDVDQLNIVGIIPVKGEVQYCGRKPLLEYTIEHALTSQYLKKVIVLTDNAELAKIAKRAGAEVPFLRPEHLSYEYVDINMVMQYTLNSLEENKIFPDLVVMMEVTYPFRPVGFVDRIISDLIEGGFDSIVPVKLENRSVWVKNEQETKPLGEQFVPRQFKDYQLYVSLLGLGMCTYPHFIRGGRLLGEKVGIVEVSDPYSQIEVRNKDSIEFAATVIQPWWKDHYASGRTSLPKVKRGNS